MLLLPKSKPDRVSSGKDIQPANNDNFQAQTNKKRNVQLKLGTK